MLAAGASVAGRRGPSTRGEFPAIRVIAGELQTASLLALGASDKSALGIERIGRDQSVRCGTFPVAFTAPQFAGGDKFSNSLFFGHGAGGSGSGIQ